MPKRISAKAFAKRSAKPRSQRASAAMPGHSAITRPDPVERTGTATKQARVIAMLQSVDGTTIAAMMQATGWQQHSVRGFLAGVVRKKLKLKLMSEKVDGRRIYRIGSDTRPKAHRQSKRRAA